MNTLEFYQKAQVVLTMGIKAIQTAFDGFWLGILSNRSLHRIDEYYYNSAKSYCTVEYNKKGLKHWECEVVDKYFQHKSRLLLLAAGGGRELYDLQKRGYTVDAFECNTKLIDFGNKFLADEGLSVSIKYLERDRTPVTTSKYDAVVIGWGAYMLTQGRSRRIAILKELRSLLSEDGKIMLSFLVRPGKSRALKTTAFVGNIFRFALRRQYLEVGDALTPTFMHYFTEDEVSEELSDAGFNIVHFARKPYGHAVAERKPH